MITLTICVCMQTLTANRKARNASQGLLAVAQRCRCLRRFSIYWNVKVSDVGLGKLLRAQPVGRLQEMSPVPWGFISFRRAFVTFPRLRRVFRACLLACLSQSLGQKGRC